MSGFPPISCMPRSTGDSFEPCSKASRLASRILFQVVADLAAVVGSVNEARSSLTSPTVGLRRPPSLKIITPRTHCRLNH